MAIAEAHLGRPLPRIPVRFDLYGTTAGMFKYCGDNKCLRFNPWIFARYFEENLRDTVPHEVAHRVVHEIHGARGVRPHGREWRALMAVFGADPAVTFERDLTGIPRRRQARHAYRCACSVHQLSTTRHNRIRRGAAQYQCRRCGDRLRPGA